MFIEHLLGLVASGPRARTQDDVTSQDTAARILALVRKSPGLPVGEIVRRLALGSGTIHYHIERLVDQKSIRTVQAGRRRLVFPLDHAGDARDAKALSLVRGRTSRLVAEAILKKPACSIVDIVRMTQESPRAVYYHVKLLKTAGLVLSASSKRYRSLKAAPHLGSILQRSQEDADKL